MASSLIQKPMSLDSSLLKSSIECTWIDKVNKVWESRDKRRTQNFLVECFDNSECVYNTALLLFCKAKDFRKGKPQGLSSLVVHTFESWLNSRHPSRYGLLTDKLRFAAIWICCEQQSTALSKKVYALFEMKTISEATLPVIDVLVHDKYYKEACVLANFLKLHDRFGLEEFLIPLILQDKIQLVQDYVSENNNLQRALIKYIDKWLGEYNELDHILARLDVTDIKRDKLNKKTINKLVSRLMKLYNVDVSECPNMMHRRSKGALFYLLSRHGEANWADLVTDAVGNDIDVQKELIINLVHLNDIQAAKNWFQYYKLSHNDLPDGVSAALTEPISDNHDDENWDDNVPDSNNEGNQNVFYKSNLTRHCIKLVDDKTKFDEFMNDIIRENTIAIDGEWKPSFGKQKSRISILQLASSSCVHIIDIIGLLGILQPEDWINFFNSVFCKKDMRKIGFGLRTDIQMLTQTVSVIETSEAPMVNILDCEWLIPAILRKNKSAFPREILASGGGCSSLSHVVEIIFGVPLCKDEQFSDWEKRPLRESQLMYAALDAYCLIDTFNHIERLCADQMIDLEAIITNFVPSNMTKRPKKNGGKRRAVALRSKLVCSDELAAVSIKFPFKTSEFFVFCDSSLKELGAYLRLCGINTEFSKIVLKPEDLVEWLLNPTRIYFTFGKEFNKVKSFLPPNMCLEIPFVSAAEQLKFLFDESKVCLPEDSDFSRCKYCNNDDFLEISYDHMKKMIIFNSVHKKVGGRGLSVLKNPQVKLETVVVIKGEELNLNLVDCHVPELELKINVADLDIEQLTNVEVFYVCSDCGEVFWENSTFGKASEVLKFLINGL